jgi:protein SCO1/2
MAASEPDHAPKRTLLQRLVGTPLFWLVWVAVIFTVPIVRAVNSDPAPPPPPVLFALPDFQLTDDQGQPYGSADLEGRIWLANFIFTRCTTVCPIFTAQMGKLQHRLHNSAAAVHLVSFSVDPDYDTPEVLAKYAYAHRASPRMWSFLTGPTLEVREAVVEGFKSAWVESETADPQGIIHGSHFALVDPKLQVRGYYALDDADTVTRVMQDVQALIMEMNQAS